MGDISTEGMRKERGLDVGSPFSQNNYNRSGFQQTYQLKHRLVRAPSCLVGTFCPTAFGKVRSFWRVAHFETQIF